MSKFNLEEYELVQDRIKRFLDEHQDARILTELVKDGDIAIFKAMIYVGDHLVATGHAEEIRGDGFVNKTCHLENCETSAIGRALSHAGYFGSKKASREEMEKVQRQEQMDAETKAKVDKLKSLPDAIKDKLKKAGYTDALKAWKFCDEYNWQEDVIEDDLNFHILEKNKRSA